MFLSAPTANRVLCGDKSLTLTKMDDRLERTYTRILRDIQGVSWKEHKNKELYRKLICEGITADEKTVIQWDCLEDETRYVKYFCLKLNTKSGRKGNRMKLTYVNQVRNSTDLRSEKLIKIIRKIIILIIIPSQNFALIKKQNYDHAQPLRFQVLFAAQAVELHVSYKKTGYMFDNKQVDEFRSKYIEAIRKFEVP